MRTMNVRLVKKWSDWDEGDVVTLEREKAKRVIARGYGHEDRSAEAARIADIQVRGGPPIRHPKVETAMREIKAETAEVTPDMTPADEDAGASAPAKGKAGRKAGD